MTKLLHQLKADHQNLLTALDLMDRELYKLRDGEENVNSRELIKQVLDYILQYPAESHFPKEEYLFRLMQNVDASLKAQIEHFHSDHNSLDHVLENLCKLVASSEQDYVQMINETEHFIHDFKDHIFKEESEFFPIAEQMFSDEEWREIDKRYEQFLDPIFGEEAAQNQHYAMLRKALGL